MAVVKKISTLTLSLAIALLLAACASSPASTSAESHVSTSAVSASTAAVAPKLSDCPVSHNKKQGGVYANITTDDFNAHGFAYGDSLNVAFSNGYTLEGIPYYSGFYVQIDALLGSIVK